MTFSLMSILPRRRCLLSDANDKSLLRLAAPRLLGRAYHRLARRQAGGRPAPSNANTPPCASMQRLNGLTAAGRRDDQPRSYITTTGAAHSHAGNAASASISARCAPARPPAQLQAADGAIRRAAAERTLPAQRRSRPCLARRSIVATARHSGALIRRPPRRAALLRRRQKHYFRAMPPFAKSHTCRHMASMFFYR